MSLLFWLCLLLLAYIYVGYPAVVWLRAVFCAKAHETRVAQPTVTLIVVALTYFPALALGPLAEGLR